VPWGDWPPPDLVERLTEELQGRSGDLAVVLGSGLGGIADALGDPWVREASEIPGYPESTVPGHHGRLLLGRLGSKEIWVVQGRVHLYEGYTPEQVTRYVRLLHRLGVRTLVLTNAAGSLTTQIRPGELVAAADVINLFLRPLAEAEAPLDLWRRRDPLVDRDLFRLAQETARELGIVLRSGVLAGSPGPNYETAAEVRASRFLGASVASMSTVPEALVARRLGMRCLLFSLVSNLATGLSAEALRHEDVVEQAGLAGGRLATLLRELVQKI